MKKESKKAKIARRKAIIEEISCRLEDMEESALLLGEPGEEYHFADAILGIISNPRPAVLYDSQKVIEAFMEQNDWSYEEAQEWYEYNTVRSLPYFEKDNAPIMVDPIEV